MVPGKLDTHIHKNEVGSHLYTIGLNVRAKAIKLLEENIMQNIDNVEFILFFKF